MPCGKNWLRQGRWTVGRQMPCGKNWFRQIGWTVGGQIPCGKNLFRRVDGQLAGKCLVEKIGSGRVDGAKAFQKTGVVGQMVGSCLAKFFEDLMAKGWANAWGKSFGYSRDGGVKMFGKRKREGERRWNPLRSSQDAWALGWTFDSRTDLVDVVLEKVTVKVTFRFLQTSILNHPLLQKY